MAIPKVTYACLIFYFLLMLHLGTAQPPSVDLSVGIIHGTSGVFMDGLTQHTVKMFLGIPFAESPVNYRRLQRPVPLDMLETNPYNATYYRPFCVQATSEPAVNIGEDEDCLYLNVFIPDKVADKPSGHAVMIWVYGGSFSSGSANLYNGTALAAVGNVIVVTINYRVGFFGFYSTGDSSAPGNYGLYDQALAFQWVHENIEAFGGDNGRVTIFGESAGSVSANLHAMYPQNTGRFQRVLGQSGVVLSPYLNTARDVSKSAMLLGQTMNCSTSSSNDTVECLRQFPWKDIKNTLLQIPNIFPSLIPVADGDMVLSDYKNLSDSHAVVEYFKSLDYLAGGNTFDGSEALSRLVAITKGDVNTMQPTQEVMDLYINILGKMGIMKVMSDSIRRTIIHEYTDWTNPESFESIRIQCVQLLTDMLYAAPAADIFQLHAGGSMSGNTFAYKFVPVTFSRLPWTPSWLPGADHAEELRFVFGMYLQFIPEWEQTLSLQIMTYWSNFAKSG